MDRKSKKLLNKKRKVYKREGKSLKYYQVCSQCELAVTKAKESFLNRIIEKTKAKRNSKGYYQAVNLLKTKEAKQVLWDVCNMYPGSTDEEISEIIASFFNQILQEYVPIPDPKQDGENIQYVQPFQVAARLRSFKKPKGLVRGDIPPELANKFADILAIPLAQIYNQVLNTLEWPLLWKTESVIVIPKNSSPSSLTELRNLSCTGRWN